MRALIARTVRLRGRHLFLIDAVGIGVMTWVAMGLRYDTVAGLEAYIPAAFVVALLVVAARMVVNVRMSLYTQDWRFASIPDFERVLIASVLGSLVALGAFVTAWAVDSRLTAGVAETFWVPELLLTTAVLGGTRFAIRALHEFASYSVAVSSDPRAALLYGAGQVGAMTARSARRYPSAGVNPVGFLDDDPRLHGTQVAGLRVYGGLDALRQTAESTGAQTLLITASNAPGAVVRRIMDAASALELEVRTVPSTMELLDGSFDAYRLRKVRVEDLLRRPVATQHGPEVEEAFADKVVLITGAGGSIGSELARQVMALRPRRLVLLDRAESALFDIHRHLVETYGDGPTELRVELANVASRMQISRIVGTERPDVILHAAAYKHVPMMEKHPSDAVHVNVAGTMALLDAAVSASVERFVLVSTDKAVKPSSVMGASKRVAEMLVADTARRTGRAYVSVRFGNVLGSNGSVVPIFTDQLERGRPLTITHPDMTRYFMTIPEASWLILDAAAIGQAGDLFVLDMGKPIKILDLARDVVRLAGRDPESQPIEFIGLRPGEKLHEELFYDAEQVKPTGTPKVMRAVADPPPTDIRAQVGRLMDFATGEHDADLKGELAAIVGGLRPEALVAASGTQTAGPVAIAIRPEQAKSRSETILGTA